MITQRELRQQELQRIILRDAFGSTLTTWRTEYVSPPEAKLRKWPSGVAGVQEKAQGFYGVTCIGGRPKLGKSIIAQRSALEAALAGWRVVHWDGENSDGEIGRRLRNGFGEDIPAGILTRWHPTCFVEGATLKELATDVASKVQADDRGVLVVIDSVSRLARGYGQYLETLRDIMRWVLNCRRMSSGQISFLLITELNHRGEVQGVNAAYAAELVLYVEGGKQEREVDLRMLSRATAGGSLGTYVRDWARLEFYSAAQGQREDPPARESEERSWWTH